MTTVRPYVVLSCATSVDGYLDSAGPDRLVLSSPADLDRVDGERARSDAILVGANTIRRDDPRLLIRSDERRAARRRRGLPEHPIKVTLTSAGALDPAARFFTLGTTDRLVYCPGPVAAVVSERLAGRAHVVGAGAPLVLSRVLDDLGRRGVRRLLVEGGARVLATFLADGLVDELQLAVAPFFVAEAGAPRFTGAGRHSAARPMTLLETRRIDDLVLLRYRLDTSVE